MTTWTLLIVFAATSNAATSISIPNLVSYAECVRVEAVVRNGPIGEAYHWGNWISQCVEGHTK